MKRHASQDGQGTDARQERVHIRLWDSIKSCLGREACKVSGPRGIHPRPAVGAEEGRLAGEIERARQRSIEPSGPVNRARRVIKVSMPMDGVHDSGLGRRVPVGGCVAESPEPDGIVLPGPVRGTQNRLYGAESWPAMPRTFPMKL